MVCHWRDRGDRRRPLARGRSALAFLARFSRRVHCIPLCLNGIRRRPASRVVRGPSRRGNDRDSVFSFFRGCALGFRCRRGAHYDVHGPKPNDSPAGRGQPVVHGPLPRRFPSPLDAGRSGSGGAIFRCCSLEPSPARQSLSGQMVVKALGRSESLSLSLGSGIHNFQRIRGLGDQGAELDILRRWFLRRWGGKMHPAGSDGKMVLSSGPVFAQPGLSRSERDSSPWPPSHVTVVAIEKEHYGSPPALSPTSVTHVYLQHR